MDSFKGVSITTPKAISYKDKPYFNKFKEDQLYKDKWFLFTSGNHYQDAKIYDSNRMSEFQDYMYKRYQESSFDYDWEIYIKPLTMYIKDYSSNYLGPFDTLFEAKHYLLRQRIHQVERVLNEITVLGVNDKQIHDRYKQLQGLEKTKKALQNWERKHPEYMI